MAKWWGKPQSGAFEAFILTILVMFFSSVLAPL